MCSLNKKHHSSSRLSPSPFSLFQRQTTLTLCFIIFLIYRELYCSWGENESANRGILGPARKAGCSLTLVSSDPEELARTMERQTPRRAAREPTIQLRYVVTGPLAFNQHASSCCILNPGADGCAWPGKRFGYQA